jgi:hypothetical protein
MDLRPSRRLPVSFLPFVLAAALLVVVFRIAGAEPAASLRYASTTGSGFACLKANPCRLIIAVGQASTGDTIYVKGGTYTGLGPSVITVTKTITMFGGWDGDPAAGRPNRNPALYPTIIDGQNSRRAVLITGTIQPVLDGFIFTHGNATGQFNGCSASDAFGCGGGMFVYHAAARIRNNKFVSNLAMQVTVDSHNNGYGGGLYVQVGSGAIISNNVFMSNTASSALNRNGGGGGLYVEGNPALPLQIFNNQFVGNVAPTWGGGANFGPYTYIAGFKGNLAKNNSAQYGAGLYSWYATLNTEHNLYTGNSGNTALYLGYAHASLAFDQIVDNQTDSGVTVINGNGGQVELTNNIIALNGGTGISATGYAGYPLTIKIYHNTLVGEGGGVAVLFKGGPINMTLVNNLVSTFDIGFLNNTPTNTVQPSQNNLFDTNVNLVGNISLSNTFVGPPAFVNAPGHNYHIFATSRAVDNALPTAIGIDIDGDFRNQGSGPDIGADETDFTLHRLALPLVHR